MHNSHHQIWVYLHFPLHLCQVAFGIALIDTLKVYRSQMIQNGTLKEDDLGSESAAHESGASASGEHGAESTGGAEHASASGSSSAAEPSQGAETSSEVAHKMARRAIEEVHGSVQAVSEPPTTALVIEKQTTTTFWQKLPQQGGYLTLCQYALSSAALTAMQALTTLDAPEEHHASSSLMKRSGGSEAELGDVTDAEKVFIYKTFLICGGLILVVNSLIKLLNTKLADIYGRIIIGARILNAIVLWSMCALPFAQLDAIVLLSVMMGSLILQAIVDLLD